MTKLKYWQFSNVFTIEGENTWNTWTRFSQCKNTKRVSWNIVPVLSIIFKTSYETGRLPSKWKEANISAIYKKGEKNDPENYSSISLTSIISKTMELII